jgi:hypothetical protein
LPHPQLAALDKTMITTLSSGLRSHPYRTRIAAVCAIGLGLAWPGCATNPARPSEIIVSGANYAQTPPAVLAKLFRTPADVVDAPPPPATAHPVHYYQFVPSERLPADLSFLEVCRLLRPALATKNLINTTEPKKADLILRITFGERPWRDPLVRENDIAWRQGLVPKQRHTSYAAGGVWDERAGGDEATLYRLEDELMETNPEAQGMTDSIIDGVHTDDYCLIVVDAFEVATLRQKGNDTPRAWTTFIALPQRKNVKFSDVAAAMIAKATPYFGETLPGRFHFTDRDGNVTYRDLKVVEEQAGHTAPKP